MMHLLVITEFFKSPSRIQFGDTMQTVKYKYLKRTEVLAYTFSLYFIDYSRWNLWHTLETSQFLRCHNNFGIKATFV